MTVVSRQAGRAAGAKLKDAQRRLAELKTRELAGALAEVETEKAEWLHVMVALRAALLAIPSRVQQAAPHRSATVLTGGWVGGSQSFECKLLHAANATL